MGGQPGIYKLEKAVLFGVKDLLNKTPYYWWPQEQYRLYSLGRFDLYPLTKGEEQKKQGKLSQEHKVVTEKTNKGCFHV